MIALIARHHGPGDTGDLVGQRDGGDLDRPPLYELDEPCVDGSMLARVFFDIALLVGAAMCSAC